MSRFGKTAVVVMVSVVVVLAGFVGWAALTSHSDDTPPPNGPAITELEAEEKRLLGER
jgi:FlaG/FlaF family flagellin (archaellin)